MDYRAIFISDVHIGLRACQAEALLDFLQKNHAPVVYLVGDIIDFWALKRTPHWPPSYNKLIHRLFEMASWGTKIIYLPGNHDDFLELCYGKYGKHMEVIDKTIHITSKGKKLLVMHGHQVDYVSREMHWLERIGDKAYDVALIFNYWLSNVQKKFGLPYWSFSAWAKHTVKGTVTYIEGYEKALAEEAERHGCTGVVCGHIHTPSITQHGYFTYYNCGDWVESLSALVEKKNGEMEIVRWTGQ